MIVQKKVCKDHSRKMWSLDISAASFSSEWKKPGALLLIIRGKRRRCLMCLLIRQQALLLRAYLSYFLGDRIVIAHFREFWDIGTSTVARRKRLGTQIDHQFMELIKNRALASNTYRKDEKMWKGATRIETKPIPSFALHFTARKKNVREWTLLEKHSPIVKKVSVFFTCHLYPAPRYASPLNLYAFRVHLRSLLVFVPSCVRFFLQMDGNHGKSLCKQQRRKVKGSGEM